MTPQEARWVEEFLIDLDPRAAALRVGLEPRAGARLLGTSKIQEAVALAKRRRANRLQLYGDDILRRWAALAGADPNECVEVRRVNCRHCHGIDHEHRYDDLEYRHALSAHRAACDALAEQNPNDPRIVPFDERGGPGYRINDPPHPDCPKCGGDGILRVVIKDSRHLSPAGRLLFDGIKTGAGGTVEVKFRDRSWAEGMIARHVGMFNDRSPIEEFDPGRMTDDQLDATVTSLVERGVVEIESDDPSRGRTSDPNVTDVTEIDEPIPSDADAEEST